MHAVALAQNGRVDCDVDHENAENACAPIYTDIYAETLELWLVLATGVCLFFQKGAGTVCLWLLMFFAFRSSVLLA